MTRFLLLLSAFLLSITAGAQSFRLYGKLTNAKSEPLPFASIGVKETGVGVTSKEDGS